MTKGDIILISFPFTDLSGAKLRPAILISDGDEDVIVLFITTQLGWQDSLDILLNPTTLNGLKKAIFNQSK